MVLLPGCFFLFESVDKEIVESFIFLKSRSDKLINAFVTEPVWNIHHLLRLDGCEFKIDDAHDIPIVIDEYVALVQVRQREHECITSRILLPKDRKQSSQRHQCRKLENTVRSPEYRIGLEA